ncbi:MAG: PepSY-associated TM helix domain-containing protein [Polyangiales bacterium]
MKVKVVFMRAWESLGGLLAARRKGVYRVHRVLGIVLALWLALLAGTGALLMFRAELDWLTTPALRVSPAAAGERDFRPARVLRGVTAYAPEATVLRVDRPETVRSASLVRVSEGAYTTELFVHPRTGAVLGGRSLDGETHSVADTLRQFHVRLLLGAWGRPLVGVLGVLWLVALVTGWWVHGRRRPTRRTRSLRARLHGGLAYTTLPFAILMGLSGAYLGLETVPYLLERVQRAHATSTNAAVPSQTPAVAQAGPPDPHTTALPEAPTVPEERHDRSHGELVRARLSELTDLDAHVRRVSPEAGVTTLFPPLEAGQTWLVALSRTSPLLPPGSVELELGASHSPRLYPPDTLGHVTGALEALHVGSFAAHAGPFAWVLRALWALLGLTPAVVALAGLYGTYRRLHVRAAKRHPLPLSPLPLRDPT